MKWTPPILRPLDTSGLARNVEDSGGASDQEYGGAACLVGGWRGKDCGGGGAPR